MKVQIAENWSVWASDWSEANLMASKCHTVYLQE